MNPEIISTISGYTFTFKEENLVVYVQRVKVTDKVTGDIKLILGKDNLEEPTFNFNFSSASTRKQLIKQLDEKYLDWKWQPIIDEICRQVQRLSQEGDAGILIRPTTSGVKPPGYYIEPVIMKGVPNIIYGDKGVNKTILCLTMLGIITNEVIDSDTGLVALSPARTAILDWENNSDLTDYNVSRLVEGGTLPYFELPYLRCSLPLADDIERIGNFLQSNKTDVILVDSLGQAAGSEKFDSAGKAAALRFFEMLRRLNLTSLIIAQNSKDEMGKKSIYGSTYFTYYARNIFRIQASREPLSDDEKIIALIHEESNFSKRYQPIGFHVSFSDSTIKIVHTEANMSQFSERVSQTKDLLEYLKSGAKSVKAIADELSISENATRVMLSRLKQRAKIVSLGSGMYGLATED